MVALAADLNAPQEAAALGPATCRAFLRERVTMVSAMPLPLRAPKFAGQW
jgi:hypothetical protein